MARVGELFEDGACVCHPWDLRSQLRTCISYAHSNSLVHTKWWQDKAQLFDIQEWLCSFYNREVPAFVPKIGKEDITVSLFFLIDGSYYQEVLLISNLNRTSHNSSFPLILPCFENDKVLLFTTIPIFENYSKIFSASSNYQKNVVLRISINYSYGGQFQGYLPFTVIFSWGLLKAFASHATAVGPEAS